MKYKKHEKSNIVDTRHKQCLLYITDDKRHSSGLCRFFHNDLFLHKSKKYINYL